ncbi:MAG TPA: hypothetical protein VKN99_01250 [Polyangia bacterium]|nr:hypothetical protein [Polyangia bacterium]
MAYPQEKLKDVYTIMKAVEGRKDRWVRIGIGFLNRDNSITVKLDATPTNGTLHIRDYVRKDNWRGDSEERMRASSDAIVGIEGGLS